jgi:hypothetical protein
MKRILVATWVVLAACGSSGADTPVSTNNPNPDASYEVPTEEEMQEQVARTEAFAATTIGMTESDAVEAIEEAGLIARVVAEDGEYFAVTEDYVTTRVNLVLVGGVVTEATAG